MVPCDDPVQMALDVVLAYRLITQRAALGHGLDQFLKMVKDVHEMMQETKGEAPAGPPAIPTRFILADGTELVPDQAGKKDIPEPTGIEKDGQVYEEAE